ncbi:hypothetical protein SCHPADRAFT_905441 [Schizopora paradoxa]|uniref:Uncharacterized protein n=1 Tax=Schizopora paradoxa TaxID=27342 RepID=A0A0H2RJP5_9AGAM|nr:hypothetical protein SCHPADRAFT_905441 [Schizopora paradoxa]
MPGLGRYGVWLLHPREGDVKSEDRFWEEYGKKVCDNEVTTYIESVVGMEFCLRWVVNETLASSKAKIFINGFYTTSRTHNADSGIGWHTLLAFRSENGSVHRHTFAPLPAAIAAESALPGPCDRACTIRVEVDHVDVHRKELSDDNEGRGTVHKEPPRALTSLLPVNDASRRAIQHAIVLGKELTGMPQHIKKPKYLNICQPCCPKPVAIFTFICRPRATLLELRVMPDPALGKAVEGIKRCKRRIEEIKIEMSDNKHQLQSLEKIKKRLKKESGRIQSQPEASAGSSLECPIDLTEPDPPVGLTTRLPIDLT